jgi:hypothetical protein
VCGNNILEPGETCDPPGSIPPGNTNTCRSDCTFCGDGITQANGGESCDDGNTVSGCRTDKPQKPRDGCLNNCQEPFCEDPSRIQLYSDRLDAIQVHGRLIATTALDFLSEDFRIRFSRRVCSHDSSLPCGTDEDCGVAGSTCTTTSVFLDQTATGGPANYGNPTQWRYLNRQAKTDGGIYSIKVVSKIASKVCAAGPNDGAKCVDASTCPQGSCAGYYAVKLKTYGDAELAVSDMQTQIFWAGHGWAVRGKWQELSRGWRLYKNSELLEPWF